MSENRRHFFSILCGRLADARLLPKYPMHDAAWELDGEVRKARPEPGRVLAGLRELLSSSRLAASDGDLRACMRGLEECLG